MRLILIAALSFPWFAAQSAVSTYYCSDFISAKAYRELDPSMTSVVLDPTRQTRFIISVPNIGNPTIVDYVMQSTIQLERRILTGPIPFYLTLSPLEIRSSQPQMASVFINKKLAVIVTDKLLVALCGDRPVTSEDIRDEARFLDPFVTMREWLMPNLSEALQSYGLYNKNGAFLAGQAVLGATLAATATVGVSRLAAILAAAATRGATAAVGILPDPESKTIQLDLKEMGASAEDVTSFLKSSAPERAKTCSEPAFNKMCTHLKSLDRYFFIQKNGA